MAIFEILNFSSQILRRYLNMKLFFDDYALKFSTLTTEKLKEESAALNYRHLSYTAEVARYRALKKELKRRQKQ